jgi:hypothetical protein
METEYTIINYNNNLIKITRYISESNNIFNKRLEFIKKLEKHEVVIDNIENLSMLWYNMKFNSCIYDITITNQIIYYDNN